ncbi:Serine/threonine protein phosphatase PrpC [Agreia bicolorata]|uniref:Serine/threonine protein phosphatase PrpC n=1 Tax=Agreia bicolorata TaxID=110935 RepID=A0A1T4XXK1_9MICO|nr:protein phosphatase 2C domain-containing protein [Agreia bicolorata]SKA94309.1 Serine/threonine protein phosphatase PrpC [Agreia bicolorata]
MSDAHIGGAAVPPVEPVLGSEVAPTVEAAPAETPAASSVPVLCPACGTVNDPDAKYCEECGTQLGDLVEVSTAPEAGETEAVAEQNEATSSTSAPRRACVYCGGSIADDGYCELCGKPAQSERDHWQEAPAAWVGGVCDRGIRHEINEDAMALAADPQPGEFAVLVVCDGVSSTPGSDKASLAAARAATAHLAAGRETDVADGHGDELAQARWSDRMLEAGERSSAAIYEAIGELAARTNPPSCTFAAAVIDGPLVVVGGVGDSRVYWIADSGKSRQLTTDDSWSQEMMAHGMSRQQAESAPQAHSITRWLGADSPHEVPHVVPTYPTGAGWILVCSDGLWNYCSDADDLAELVHRVVGLVGSNPVQVASSLVDWANEQGGQDNITAVLARFDSVVPTPAQPA